MVEESVVLSHYRFVLSEEEFIIKEEEEMEARISRVSLTTSCQITQGSWGSCDLQMLYFYGLSQSNIVLSCMYTKQRLG